MKKKLKLRDLKVESFLTALDPNDVKGGNATLACLTGTETWYFPCTHGGGTTCSPSNPIQCDIQSLPC